MRIEPVTTAVEPTIAWLRPLLSATSGLGRRVSEHEAAQQRPSQAARAVRILVENSEYWLRNNGDLAAFDRVVTLTRGRATAAIGSTRDHLPTAADPA